MTTVSVPLARFDCDFRCYDTANRNQIECGQRGKARHAPVRGARAGRRGWYRCGQKLQALGGLTLTRYRRVVVKLSGEALAGPSGTGVDPANLPEGQAHIQPQFGTPEYAFNVVAHAAVGCGSAVASGGKCGPSALAGGVTSAAGPVINGQGFVAGLVINTALGGGAAVLGGGKFENGAITSAFGYLFNYLAKIFNDDSFGGHTIERHVGKPIEYLQDRLYLQPDIDAASTYRNLAEATAVT